MSRAPRRAIAALSACLAASLAHADGTSASVSWPGWSVSSTEALWAGRTGPARPLSFMFDGDPATCWVWSAVRHEPAYEHPHILTLTPATAVAADALHVMNGDNTSDSAFRKSPRVRSIEVWNGGQRIAVANLPDAMGWHVVRFERQPIESLVVALISTHPGPAGAIRVAELVLRDRGRAIDVAMPHAVILCDGGEATSDTCRLGTRDGAPLAEDDSGLFAGAAAWSVSGRRVAGIDRRDDGDRLWVYDARDAAKLLDAPLAKVDDAEYEMSWDGEDGVRVTVTGADGVAHVLSFAVTRTSPSSTGAAAPPPAPDPR